MPPKRFAPTKGSGRLTKNEREQRELEEEQRKRKRDKGVYKDSIGELEREHKRKQLAEDRKARKQQEHRAPAPTKEDLERSAEAGPSTVENEQNGEGSATGTGKKRKLVTGEENNAKRLKVDEETSRKAQKASNAESELSEEEGLKDTFRPNNEGVQDVADIYTKRGQDGDLLPIYIPSRNTSEWIDSHYIHMTEHGQKVLKTKLEDGGTLSIPEHTFFNESNQQAHTANETRRGGRQQGDSNVKKAAKKSQAANFRHDVEDPREKMERFYHRDRKERLKAALAGELDPEQNAEAYRLRNTQWVIQFPQDMPSLLPKREQSFVPNGRKRKYKATDGTSEEEAAFGLEVPEAILDSKTLAKQAGYVGKLRIRQSGEAEMDWGGLPFKVQLSTNKPQHLQQAFQLDRGDTETVDGDNGMFKSIGEVVGKLLLIPDFADLERAAKAWEEEVDEELAQTNEVTT